MKTKISICTLSFVQCLLCAYQATSLAQNAKVSWSTFDMGFAVSSTPSNISAKSAVGQLFVGASSLAKNMIEAGFLADTLMRGTIVAVIEDRDIPATFALGQNYPNPFNSTTNIRFQIPYPSFVSLMVFDLLGREVATLVDGVEAAGDKTVQFDASGLASGIYVYRLQSGSFVETKKCVVLR